MTSPTTRPRTVTLRALLYAALLAAGVFAAYQVHVYWVRANDAVDPYAPNGHPWRPASPAQAELDGGTLLESLWGAEGLTPLAGDPGGLPPPASAQRFTGFERATGDMRYQFASYRFDGDGEQALTHYRKQLQERGYERLSGGRDEQGRRREEFIANGRKVIVALLNDTGDSRIGRLAVAVFEPTASGRPSE